MNEVRGYITCADSVSNSHYKTVTTNNTRSIEKF